MYFYIANVTEKTIEPNKKNNFLKNNYRFCYIYIFVKNKPVEILRLKEVLKEKGITSKDLALKVNITENALSMIINGKRQPRFELLIEISNVLDVDVRELFIPTKEDEQETIYIQTKEGLIPIGEIKKGSV